MNVDSLLDQGSIAFFCVLRFQNELIYLLDNLKSLSIDDSEGHLIFV